MRIKGREIAEKIFVDLQKRAGELQKKGITPHLVVILIGQSPASVAYVNQKQKRGEETGVKVTVLRYDETVTTQTLTKKVKELNNDKTVHAILIQRPVPAHIDVEKLVALTDPQKDIDGFHPDSPYTLPLPLSVMKIIEEIYKLRKAVGVTRVGDPHRAHAAATRSSTLKDEPSGSDSNETSDGGGERQYPDKVKSWLKSKNIITIGKGPTGGKPVIEHLKKFGLNPTIIDSKTSNPDQIIKNADIIVSCVGRENVIKPGSLKKGVILIGVGIFRGKDGKLHGDYNESEIENIASFYTPTPGGVGPVNVAMLMDNLLTAAEKQTQNP